MLIFINSLLKKLPAEVTFCYANDITLVVPYMGAENKKVIYLKLNLDICTNWSEEKGLKFNVEKCELLNLGFRKPPETDFELCGETIKKAEKNKLKILDVHKYMNFAQTFQD